MSGRLEGKTAIVTGGGSGIGRAIAQRFAKEGARVLIAGRRQSKLEEVAASDGNIAYVVANLTKSEDVAKLVEEAKKRFGGKLDILVNNAGWCPVQSIKEITLADYDKAFSLDVRAVVDMTIQGLSMVIAAKGNIINLSTIGVTHRDTNLSMYIGAKSAVENFTRCWALDLANDGVRVNAIAPGAIRTEIWTVTNLDKEAERAHEERITSTIPTGCFGSPEEIANTALFLVSDEAPYINGAVIAVDGAAGAR